MRSSEEKYFKGRHPCAVTLNDLAKKWRRFAEMERRITAKLTEDDPHANINDETRRELKRTAEARME